MRLQSPDDVRAAYGATEFTSPWVDVTQELMDEFGRATKDPDWMHVDPVRAAEEGPYEGTIAFGFWTLGMLTHFMRASTGREYPEGVAWGLNYGLNKVRLLAPVPVGSRIRNHMTIGEIVERSPGRFLVTTHNQVEIEGHEKPAMVAEWLALLVAEGAE